VTGQRRRPQIGQLNQSARLKHVIDGSIVHRTPPAVLDIDCVTNLAKYYTGKLQSKGGKIVCHYDQVFLSGGLAAVNCSLSSLSNLQPLDFASPHSDPFLHPAPATGRKEWGKRIERRQRGRRSHRTVVL
jgi:hypothetical protein